MKIAMFRRLLFVGLALPAVCGASVKDLAVAARIFAATIQTQLETLDNNPSSVEFAQATISYAQAKAEYYKVLADEMPELMAIALGKQTRPPELDKFAEAFALSGAIQEREADQETREILKQFSDDPQTEKARVEFESAQKLEEAFKQEFEALEVG